MNAWRIPLPCIAASCALLLLASCSGDPEAIAESRFAGPDKLFEVLASNIGNHPGFEVIADIDHARLAAKAGAPMPPARVLIWSDPVLDAAILKSNPRAAVDLPLRILAFEDQASGTAAVIANRFDFLVNRHSLPDDAAMRGRYAAAIATATQGIGANAIARFASDQMPDTELVTLDSPHDFETTEALLMKVIGAEPDTVHFVTVDFAARAKAQGVDLPPLRLILFGAPGPGGQAMREAPTLGLDAFCQKLLIWEDASGLVHVTFNDLLALAERQQVAAGIPLRVINRRINKTFTEALEK